MADAAHDPIVIVGTARTAIGGFQGAFAPLTAPQARRAPQLGAVHHRQQDVRLGHEDGHDGLRGAARAAEGYPRRRRHGEHDDQGRGGAVHRRRRGNRGGGRAAGVRTIHTEVDVGAPAARVWAILADFDGWAQWNPFARVKGRLAVGERLEVEISLPDKSPMTFRPRIVTLEPGRELRWLGSLGMRGVFDGEHGFRVVPGMPAAAASSSSRASAACWLPRSCGRSRRRPAPASGS